MQLRVLTPLLNASIRKVTCLLCLAFLCQPASAQLNKEWQDMDRRLFTQFQLIDRNEPKSVERFFDSHQNYFRPDTLGFGWIKVRKAKYGGYIGILADLYYFKDSLYSYLLYSRLPYDKEADSAYEPILQNIFPERRPRDYSFSHGKQFINMPLADFYSTGLKLDSSASIQEYMSPESGIDYGKRGGESSGVLPNRKAFSLIADSITPSDIQQIMYSVNPASRLTAIEYYLKHKSRFSKQAEIDAWISTVYKALPKVSTMHGCIGTRDNARQLVEQFVKAE